MTIKESILNFKKNLFSPYAEKVSQSRRISTNPSVIKIVEGFKDRSRKDIDKWRNAVLMTQIPENPRFQEYHDLVEDLLTDGHLQSQIQMRISATLNADFHIVNRKTGDENQELSFVFQQQWFYYVLEQYLMHIIKGYKLLEFRSFNHDKIEITEIPQRHLVPTKNKIIPNTSDYESFIDFSRPELQKWLISFGASNYLGLINNIIPSIIWKRNVEQSWAEFCERFGIPLITATTPAREAKDIDKVHDLLIGIGEASVGAFPQGTEVKIHEANRTDAFRVYKEFISLNQDAISKQLVGSTMLSDQGSNRSQTEVHERTLDDKIARMDKRGAIFMVNNQLFPLLKEHGYKISDDDVFRFKNIEKEIDINNLWLITNGLLDKGYQIEQNWLSKTFNIPIEGKEIKKKSPKVIINSRYPESCCKSLPTASVNELSSKLVQLTKKLAELVFNRSETIGILGEIIALEGGFLAKALLTNFDTDKTYTGQDKLVLQMMEYNCYEFACSRTSERHFLISSRLIDYKKNIIKSKSEFIQTCLEDNKNLNTNWLSTEYDLVISTAQNSANYLRAVKEARKGGTRFYEYQTMGDELVRPAHSILDGKVFDILEDTEKAIYPPNGYNCRCEMIPHLGGLQTTTWDKAKTLLMNNDKHYANSQFMLNRSELKKIFTDKQFYRDTNDYTEKINKMSFDKYDLKKWKDFKDSLNTIKIDNSITENNAHELFKKVKNKDYAGFKDHINRKLFVTQKTFKKLIKKEPHLYPKITEVLSTPDEVWLNNYADGKFKSNYIKFFKDTAVVVNVDVNDKLKGLEINAWYSEKSIDTVRKGILIKKMNNDE